LSKTATAQLKPRPIKRVSKRGRIWEGRPTKATPERIDAILKAIAKGLTREQACAKNDVSLDQFSEWEKRPEFPGLRAKALASRAESLLDKIEFDDPSGWQRLAWLLERPKCFGNQFVDPTKASVQVNTQQNFVITKEQITEIEAQRARLEPEINQLMEERENARRKT